MPSAQDPFYVVKEEIQDSIDKLQSSFHHWERIPGDSGEQLHLAKELLASCESIEWQINNHRLMFYATTVIMTFAFVCFFFIQHSLQLLKAYFLDRKVDELDKTIAVAARDPALYGIDESELEKRRRWTSNARTQVSTVKKALKRGKETGTGTTSANAMRRELMRLPNPHGTDRSNPYFANDNDDFIASESDRQLLLIKQQDEELDELSASVQRIGGVGLTIHEELLQQEKIIEDLDKEMDSTSNRLDFVQKKVAMVMKKAGAKGQMMMILFLVVLFIILFVLVFFT
ncbi:Syntaxin [Trema orientale]|uniref:Syntaxin n=1 Tax=Trema orientale TaxID=63057 RepID=A0A2P5F2F8_TREOI|nr:Syntaxin [Trema orientale]